jgi:small subunit ribosomal protein S10
MVLFATSPLSTPKLPIDLEGLTEKELFELRNQLRLYTSENPDPQSPLRFLKPLQFTKPNAIARQQLGTLTYDELEILDAELSKLADGTPTETISESEFSSLQFPGRGLYPPLHHPKTHGVPIATVQFRSHAKHPMDLFLHFATHAAAGLGMPVSRVVSLPTKRNMWTVIRSPFAHKKSQENFERLTHKRLIKVWDTDPEVFDRWLRYIRKHSVAGVGMRVVRWERVEIGVGQHIADAVEEKLEGTRANKAKVQALADTIIKREMAAISASNAASRTAAKKPSSTKKV